MKKKIITKKKKFAYGGTPMDVDSPMQDLFKMINNTELAGAKSANDPLVMGLNSLGAAAGSTAMSFAGQGMNSMGSIQDIFQNMMASKPNIKDFLPGADVSRAANGGKMGGSKIEVEGKEVYETPGGEVGEFKGPSHEAGGIPLNVGGGKAQDGQIPHGTYIYPDSIKVDGKTLAERKKIRDRKEKRIQDLLGGNSDAILKNTLGRVKEVNTKQDNHDVAVQQYVQKEKEYDDNLKKFNDGGPVSGGYQVPDLLKQMRAAYKSFVPTATPPPVVHADKVAPSSEFDFNNAALSTFGDFTGMAGNLYQAFKPMQNTLNERAGDTPNINPYAHYGEEALKTLDGNKQFLQGMLDNQMGDAELSRTGTFNRNADSAKGINTLRALNLATDAQHDNLKKDIFSKYTEQLMGVNDRMASTQLDISGKKAGGEQYRDLSDRQDRDAFFTNMSKDYAAMGEGVSRTGKALNEVKARGTQANFMNMMFDYVNGDVMNGKISQKAGVENMAGRDPKTIISDFKKSEAYTKASPDMRKKIDSMTDYDLIQQIMNFK